MIMPINELGSKLAKHEIAGIIFIVVFIVLFFGKIIINFFDYKEYQAEFKIKCAEKSGLMVIHGGRRGWARIECRNPDSIINVDIDNW
jgi:hypothetical protein